MECRQWLVTGCLHARLVSISISLSLSSPHLRQPLQRLLHQDSKPATIVTLRRLPEHVDTSLELPHPFPAHDFQILGARPGRRSPSPLWICWADDGRDGQGGHTWQEPHLATPFRFLVEIVNEVATQDDQLLDPTTVLRRRVRVPKQRIGDRFERAERRVHLLSGQEMSWPGQRWPRLGPVAAAI